VSIRNPNVLDSMRFPLSARTRLLVCALPLLAVACGSRGDAPATSEAVANPAVSTAPAAEAAPATGTVAAAELPVVHVYKSPTCGCCTDWVTHIEAAGFKAEVQDMPDVTPIKRRAGLPQDLESCHTSLVGDYVVEGHVPASTLRRLLAEKPAIAGIAVPGMPMGSPGMEGPWKDPYDVIAFTRDGRRMVYESH
jgi:hypothetical protein